VERNGQLPGSGDQLERLPELVEVVIVADDRDAVAVVSTVDDAPLDEQRCDAEAGRVPGQGRCAICLTFALTDWSARFEDLLYEPWVVSSAG